MTTKKTKELTLADFMTDTNLSKPAKMALTMDNEKTNHYFMVVGAQSKSVMRARLVWGTSTNTANEEINKIKCEIDRAVTKAELLGIINDEFALQLIVDWSFDSFNTESAAKLLADNDGLSDAVINFAFGRESTLEKK